MPITWKAQLRYDPRSWETPEAERPKKYYVSIVQQGQITLEQLGRRIARRITAQNADVQAVLAAIQPLFRENLLSGKVVSLSQIGRWRVTFHGIGAATEAEAEAQLVNNVMIRFKPGKRITTKFKLGPGSTLVFEKAKYTTNIPEEEAP